jgi:hypothetical protein
MGNVTFSGLPRQHCCFGPVATHLVTLGWPRLAAGEVGATGLIAVIVDESPSWGSDLGGPRPCREP